MTAVPPTPPPSLLSTLDRALRGEYLDPNNQIDGGIPVSLARFIRLAVLLGAFYGICVGSFAALHGGDQAGLQMVAAALKVPLLFALTLAITFPSLYVFAALQRLPLAIGSTLRLMMLSIVVHLAVLASLGPVFSFFAASTDSYAFLKLLNVAFFAIGGVLGFMMLHTATRGMFDGPELQGPALPGSDRRRAGQVLRVWCIVYAVVGAQMGWLLRPFLGSPDLAFAWFRPRDGSIFTGVLDSFRQLFAG